MEGEEDKERERMRGVNREEEEEGNQTILLLSGEIERVEELVVLVAVVSGLVRAAVGLLLKRKYYTCFHRKEFRRISGGGFAGCDSFLVALGACAH